MEIPVGIPTGTSVGIPIRSPILELVEIPIRVPMRTPIGFPRGTRVCVCVWILKERFQSHQPSGLLDSAADGHVACHDGSDLKNLHSTREKRDSNGETHSALQTGPQEFGVFSIKHVKTNEQ